jgi:GNAT superfamily N-acetyltransferase
MSEETRYHRFHNFLVELPEDLRERLLDINHRDTEALVAVTPRTGEIVAGVRFTRYVEDPHVADLAFIAVDDWQRRGLAALLLWRLAKRAAEEDVRQFTGVILATNRPALELVQRLGPAEITAEGTVANVRMDVKQWPQADLSGAEVIRVYW